MKFENLQDVFLEQQHQARKYNQRRLIVIQGEREWLETQLALLINNIPDLSPTIISDKIILNKSQISQQLKPIKAKQLLGQGIGHLIYDTYAGVDPEGIAAAIGAVNGGHIVFLLTPPFKKWAYYNDPDYQRITVFPYKQEELTKHFITHIIRSLKASDNVAYFSTSECLIENISEEVSIGEDEEFSAYSYGCVNADQQQAVEEIIKLSRSSHARRPFVLTADRGRGKSTSLGLACAELMRSQQKNIAILITAPRLSSVQIVFDVIAEALSIDYKTATTSIHYVNEHKARCELRFLAPDHIIQQQPDADLLLVDEAAMIPVPMLDKFLNFYNRTIFSSTTHGYEGTGQGFAIKFKELLSEKTPQWRGFDMQTPIRWSKNDPVERWIYQALLLDAAGSTSLDVPKFLKGESEQHLDIEFSLIRREELMGDDELLKSVFGLLVTAHYQTSPNDLRNMLDGPNLNIWVARAEGQVLATALVSIEGGFDTNMTNAIWRGERRLRGHLLAQTLTSHGGFQGAAELRYARIMRIAVQPELQRQGLGQQLVHCIIDQAIDEDIDLVGSSFAMTYESLMFWQHCMFQSLRLGISRDTCSGAYSSMVLLPLSQKGDVLFKTARLRFLQQLPFQLPLLYRELDYRLVINLLNKDAPLQFRQQDWLDVESFIKAYRLLEVCFVSLHNLVLATLGRREIAVLLSPKQQAIMVQVLLQQQPLSLVAKNHYYQGKKDLLQGLREALTIIYDHELDKPRVIH